MKDDLGDRMKSYELAAEIRLDPSQYLMARLDGRCFSKFTHGLTKPFDSRLWGLMVLVTEKLMRESGACLGYTQSDEITLVWPQTPIGEPFFGGRTQKLSSSLAAMATLHFFKTLPQFFGVVGEYHQEKCPTFDCRVWAMPSSIEVWNNLLWRYNDATRNAIIGITRVRYSHTEMYGLDCTQMLSLPSVMDDWGVCPPFFKVGTFVQRYKVSRPYTVTELASLPPMHEARTNPELVVERSDYRTWGVESFKIVENKEGFIFAGEEPVLSRNTNNPGL